MAKFKIILLYFVLPVLALAAFVLHEVGVKRFEVTMMIVGVVVFLIFGWLRTAPSQRRDALESDEAAHQQGQDDWSTYYSIQEIDKHRE